ncbi:MAG: uroporphyrinogen-III C-methyltransferase [Clostridium sp.]|nr:uroporphyrinogen-III C-methyltransferase [Clostridium sp.]
MIGKVYITGAGSGNEGLITLKAIQCIKKADVIVYDRLINKKFLEYAKENTEKIDAGKKSSNHTLPQWRINEIIANKALEGKTVVRLKGGEPFIFGRGSEEALYLAKKGIEFEIVPGISAVNAVLGYAGIPLTHRGINSSFHVITGHEDPSKNESDIDYSVISKLKGTLVFFMGLNNLNAICTNLIKYGKDPKTPAAVISNGTLINQKTVCKTLEDITEFKEEMSSPALIVVGETALLRENLNWFENKKRVLVTRAKNQYEKMENAILDVGAIPVSMPMIEIEDNLYKPEIKEMYKNIEKYDWIVFTSQNAVNIFMRGFQYEGLDIRSISHAKIACIGSSTESELKKYYLNADVKPSEFKSEELALELKSRVKQNEKILIPTSSIAHNSIAKTIQGSVKCVDIRYMYDVAAPKYKKGELQNKLKNIDVITFTSPSCVNGFMDTLKNDEIEIKELSTKKIICIGPITAGALDKYGIKEYICSNVHTVRGMAEEI